MIPGSQTKGEYRGRRLSAVKTEHLTRPAGVTADAAIAESERQILAALRKTLVAGTVAQAAPSVLVLVFGVVIVAAGRLSC